jgi:hypothetical protein
LSVALVVSCCLLVAGLLGCSVSAARELPDSYESAIRQAVKIMGDAGEKARLGKIFHESMRGWREQASYSEVRNLVRSLRGIKRQVRIEVRNVNMGTYRVVWLVEYESGVRAISNVFSAGKLVQTNVPKNAWGEFLKFLASRGRVSGCQSDLAVDDGSSYFGTIAADGMVQSFAVYGFVPVPRRPDDNAIYKKLAPCSEFVEAVYSLLPSGKLPEQGFHEVNIVTQFTQKRASTLLPSRFASGGRWR